VSIGAFCQYFSQISWGVLIHACVLFTDVYGIWHQ